jgi:predicted  nucleic acid-binding Zn-ribbon protein
MSRESFENLREVQSLLREEKELLDKISAEKKRMTQLELQKTNREKKVKDEQEQLIEIKKSALSIDKELSLKQDQLTRAKSALDLATSEAQASAGEKQKLSFEQSIDQLQNEAYELLEKEDLLQESIKEDSHFLLGIAQTIIDLAIEVDKEVANLTAQLEVNKQRRENLLSITEKPLVFAFEEACKKHRHHSPLTTINNRCCRLCNYMPEGILLSAIERGDEAHHCDGCQRLFSPL